MKTIDKKNIDKDKIKKIIRFFLILFSVIGTYYAVVLFLSEELFDPYINLNAYLSGLLIKIFDSSVYVENNMIITKKINMVLSFGCEGSEALVIFLAGVLAFPAHFKYKIKGILIGGSILYTLNLLRVMMLYLVVMVDVSMFDAFHNEILPIFFIMISLVFWYYWLKNIPEAKND